MPFDINNFMAEINARGVSKLSNYEVFLHRRTGGDAEFARSLSFRCQTFEVPGRTIMTSEKKVYGPSYKIGYDSMFSELPMTILLSEDWREKTYFEQWQDLTVGSYANGEQNTSMYDIGYYDDYIADLDVQVYDDAGKKKYKLKIYEAYPVAVGGVQMAHAGGNEVAILPVSMSFKYTVRS